MKRIMPQFKSKSISNALASGFCEAAMQELIASVVAPTPGFAGRNEYNNSEACTATGRRERFSLTLFRHSVTHRRSKGAARYSRMPRAHDLH